MIKSGRVVAILRLEFLASSSSLGQSVSGKLTARFCRRKFRVKLNSVLSLSNIIFVYKSTLILNIPYVQEVLYISKLRLAIYKWTGLL